MSIRIGVLFVGPFSRLSLLGGAAGGGPLLRGDERALLLQRDGSAARPGQLLGDLDVGVQVVTVGRSDGTPRQGGRPAERTSHQRQTGGGLLTAKWANVYICNMYSCLTKCNH